MNATQLQTWLNAHGATLTVDGNPGPMTRAAIKEVFANPCAPAVTDAQIAVLAARLGCTVAQLRAVSAVESGAAGFDRHGRPKILFERHLFHRLTDGKWSPSAFSQAKGGGYAEDSWAKLQLAACKDPDAAFSACSWGKFQVLGLHWSALDYPSPIELAYSCVTGEAAHYELLARYIERNGLVGPLRALSGDPEDNRLFARGYNGPAYERFRYHIKLAEALR